MEVKITQEPKFQPISITIETSNQALALWALVETWEEPNNAKPIDADIEALCRELS